ncbi:unnamed protein product [Adineta steineri]|uniref:VWFA domain-containing protein n=1 Tax=Adineta steineri TaxID=433720 RepID=A0A815WA66_9BILA|nr:unnamed protein product [Adineta steineri]CAF1659350.1 unnamed protein product [Adineta steineri]
MATGEGKFTCSVCKQLFKNPVVHKLCGISFDRECLGNLCPEQQCQQVIIEDDLIPNRSLLNVVDEYRLTLVSPPVYYMILLDCSTSMWYSDAWLPFALGQSRFVYAIDFLNEFFRLKLNLITDKVSLVTFDTASLQRFDFQVINENHIAMLKDLKCDGQDTALFDAIDFCYDRLEELNKRLGNQQSNLYLLVLTDGQNNFGLKESKHADNLLFRSKKLHISGHMIQIGSKNRKTTRTLCKVLQFQYNHFKGGNVNEFVNSLTNTLTTKARSRVQPTKNIAEQLIDQLPTVPNTPIKAPNTPVKVPRRQLESA